MTPTEQPQRPALSANISAHEFYRWYWLKTELAAFARASGLPATGGKEDLAARISAHLDGLPQPALPRKTPPGKQLSGPLNATTLVPRGQRCSQPLRGWFEGQLGGGFHFDAHMRGFFADADGTSTLHDAVAHWHSTRSAEPTVIGQQFELNQFTRKWFSENPNSTREEMHAAWQRHRALPKDLRPSTSGTGS